MSIRSNKVEAITKYELVRRIAKKTGFTIGNSTTALDAVVEAIADVMLEGRAVTFKCFGRLEPYTKTERKLYKLSTKTGIALDENGEKVTYTMPATKWIKFHMAQSFKYKMNPGIYDDEPVNTDDSD